jgi:signal transduction histidine kinase
MNRLWVRLSLVIAGIVIFVSLLPLLGRLIWHPKNLPAPPVPPEEVTLSAERITRIQEAIEARTRQVIYRDLLVGGIVGLLAGVILSRELTAPLNRLEKGARALAERRWDYRVPVRGSQEMRSVARSFNQMAAELEQAETRRSNMLADVTHELRHPIHLLQGNLQAILDGVYPLSMQEVARLLEQTRHLIDIANDLHLLAEAEALQLPLNLQDTDLCALIQHVVEIFAPLAASREIALRSELPADPVKHPVDAARLQQVIQNLLSNALHHTPPGGEICVSLGQGREAITIRVQDSGEGIPAEQLPHIFDRFYRADASRSRETGSTGLGLAIAQAITQAHGGQIEAHSAGANLGSTFSITLPISPVDSLT